MQMTRRHVAEAQAFSSREPRSCVQSLHEVITCSFVARICLFGPRDTSRSNSYSQSHEHLHEENGGSEDDQMTEKDQAGRVAQDLMQHTSLDPARPPTDNAVPEIEHEKSGPEVDKSSALGDMLTPRPAEPQADGEPDALAG